MAELCLKPLFISIPSGGKYFTGIENIQRIESMFDPLLERNNVSVHLIPYLIARPPPAFSATFPPIKHDSKLMG
jgi:hypothetical protein